MYEPLQDAGLYSARARQRQVPPLPLRCLSPSFPDSLPLSLPPSLPPCLPPTHRATFPPTFPLRPSRPRTPVVLSRSVPLACAGRPAPSILVGRAHGMSHGRQPRAGYRLCLAPRGPCCRAAPSVSLCRVGPPARMPSRHPRRAPPLPPPPPQLSPARAAHARRRLRRPAFPRHPVPPHPSVAPRSESLVPRPAASVTARPRPPGKSRARPRAARA